MLCRASCVGARGSLWQLCLLGPLLLCGVCSSTGRGLGACLPSNRAFFTDNVTLLLQRQLITSVINGGHVWRQAGGWGSVTEKLVYLHTLLAAQLIRTNRRTSRAVYPADRSARPDAELLSSYRWPAGQSLPCTPVLLGHGASYAQYAPASGKPPPPPAQCSAAQHNKYGRPQQRRASARSQRPPSPARRLRAARPWQHAAAPARRPTSY